MGEGSDLNRWEAFPDAGFYAQMESGVTLQDYVPRHECVRLIGISPLSFIQNMYAQETGCQTYIIDVSWKDLTKLAIQTGDFLLLHVLDSFRASADYDFLDNWIELVHDISPTVTDSYAYSAFTNELPTYLIIKSFKILNSPVIIPPLLPEKLASPAPQFGHGTLTAFHVGQGMCSLFSYGADHFLLDAGAGTPVNRAAYKSGYHVDLSRFYNDLENMTFDKTLTAIISHSDSDHWRLLEWDPILLGHVSSIYLPSGTPSLALRSPQVIGKVKGLSTCAIEFDRNNQLQVFRTDPLHSDKNGEALVVRVLCNGLNALVPGDYVYDRIATDNDRDLATLAYCSYGAIIVPHHGDEASANAVPSSLWWRARAFFSAGTHARYRHPRKASLDAHASAGFTVISDRSCRDIKAFQLL